MKTVRAFDVEAIEEGDITARLCLLCYNSRTVHHLDPSLAVKGRWAVTNHDDSGGPATLATPIWSTPCGTGR